MSDEDIRTILIQSRANNAQVGITGAMLYSRGRFVQILEGPEDQVLDRFARISSDPRHVNVHMLDREPITERQFPTWTMGYRSPEGAPVKGLEGLDEFFSRTGRVNIKNADPSAQLFLEWLSDYWFAG